MKDNIRLWGIVAGAAVLAVLAGGYFLGVSPMLASAAAADTTTAGVAAQNQALQIKLAGLAKAAAKTDELTARAGVLYKAVPTSLQPNTFVRRVNTIAAEDGVTVAAVTPGAAQPYTLPASIQAAATASAAAAAAAAAPTPTASATPAATAAPATPVIAAPALAATDPSITAEDFTVVPMTVSVKGTQDAALQFVHDMQNDERLYLVSGYSMASDSTSATTITATLTGYIYTLKQ